ncbi:MAG TPA: M28 family peptidase [Ginsengibacter sp.]
MKLIFIVSLVLMSTIAQSQNIPFNREIVDTLASPYFWGRGYTNDGMKKAANFLEAEFKTIGVQPLNGKDYFQNFSYPANTFPGKMEVEINGLSLTPGVDFIVGPESRGAKGKGKLEEKDSADFIDFENRIIVNMQDKLTWSVEQQVADYTLIQIDKKKFTGIPATYKINIENKFINDFKTANVCGMVKGTAQPDSFIFITAHYDHLGGMGKDTYFPGANDNASGDALLLSLAKYYAAHPAKYSIGFLLFAGEEAGLVGSKYYTEHPIVPLKNIRFLINTDLAGTGDEGITVVNATEFPNEFALMNKINDEYKYLVKINPRGKAANSDHYFFTEKGVPAFFFYTLGGIKAYHDVFDKASTLPLNEQDHLDSLLIKFNAGLMGN